MIELERIAEVDSSAVISKSIRVTEGSQKDAVGPAINQIGLEESIKNSERDKMNNSMQQYQ